MSKSKTTTTTTTAPKMNLYAASNQWATRPADERFWTVEDAQAACLAYATTAVEKPLTLQADSITHDGHNILIGVGDENPATMTNWGFGQLAKIASAPAGYLRSLPAGVAVDCLKAGILKGGESKEQSVMFHKNGTNILRSVTSTIYKRIWNHEVFGRLVNLQESGWKVPPGRVSPMGDDRARPATKADVLRVKSTGGGQSVKVGDMIAPAGIYASDHDMFCFMINEDNRIEDGSDGGLSRGFFIQNSEVGAAALKVNCFQYRHVCGNHIVWDATNVINVTLRHVGEVMTKFESEALPALDKYLKASAKEETARVARARKLSLGKDETEVIATVYKALAGNRRGGINSGLNVKMITDAIQMCRENEATDGDPFTCWGFVNGFTRLSQLTGFADDRDFMDRAAAAVLALAV